MPSLSPAKPPSACLFCESCTDCGCGPDCRCSEALCQCQASALLNSINFSFSLYKAEWTVDMHCQSCVRVTQNVLGEQAAINFAAKSASLIVNSEEEAKELTEALLDVGLDTTLVKLVRIDKATPKSCSRNAKKDATESPLTLSSKDTEDPESLSLLESTSEPSHDLLAPLPSHPSPNTTTPIELAIGGMTCSMCSKAVTQTLQHLPGVQKVDVSLATNMATIVLAPNSTTTSEQLQHAVESVGYTASPIITTEAASKIQQMQDSQQADVVRKKQSFLLSLVGTLPISIMTMLLPHFRIPWLHSTTTIRGHVFLQESLILAALGTLVQFGSGWTFYKTSYNNIVSGQLGMDVLVAVGTTASYVYAWIQTWKGLEAHAFETSAVLISFVLLGKWMNSLAVRRTSEALTQLMKLQSKTAIQIMPDGSEQTVPVEQIHPGDTVRIRRGASLPADGIVSIGYMTVDESMMTGESMPILKTAGSLVLGGTVCTESDGALVVVTGVGANTALAQIVQLVQDAQTRQVPIQDLADTISSIFVPTVCTLAVLTFVVWFILCKTGVVPPEWYQDEGDVTFSLMFAIACLVISCPCALGLATPTAVMVSTRCFVTLSMLEKQYNSHYRSILHFLTGGNWCGCQIWSPHEGRRNFGNGVESERRRFRQDWYVDNKSPNYF
jgi:cation transport ATPase